MQVRSSSKMLAVVGAMLAFGAVAAPADAARSASKRGGHAAVSVAASSHRAPSGALKGGVRIASVRTSAHKGGGKSRGAQFAYSGYSSGGGGGISCVPFARENSGIELAGNAGTWWGNAAGVYERGARPEVGSVLNFRSNGRMRMGHVAVVTNVLNGRTIEIDHANWGSRGRVSRSVHVVDVSEANDWTAVRVALGTGDYGSIYPTYGFIYDRPDRGTMVANSRVAVMPVLASAAPRDLRPVALRTSATAAPDEEFDEVAEAPDDEPAPSAVASSRRVRRNLVHRAKATVSAPHAATHRSSARRSHR